VPARARRRPGRRRNARARRQARRRCARMDSDASSLPNPVRVDHAAEILNLVRWGRAISGPWRSISVALRYCPFRSHLRHARRTRSNEYSDRSTLCRMPPTGPTDRCRTRPCTRRAANIPVCSRVAVAYERSDVKHHGALPELEDAMCDYGLSSGRATDRLEALVHAVTELLPPRRPEPTLVGARGVRLRRARRTSAARIRCRSTSPPAEARAICCRRRRSPRPALPWRCGFRSPAGWRSPHGCRCPPPGR
jgi:hypothetical protein